MLRSPTMGFLTKLIARFLLNGLALYVATLYFPKFVLAGGAESLAAGALVLTVLNLFLRPILKLVSTPLIWVTFGLFNIVIHVAILWLADLVLTQLTIGDLPTLFWVSIIIAIANSFF